MMQDRAEQRLLATYDNPPVVETILGVQFEGLPGFKNAHLGAFWKTLDPDEWPAVFDAPPLEPQFESFAESARWAKARVHFKLMQEVPSRLQIKNKVGDRMIQIQNGRLHFNGLGQAGGPYPHYERVREGFIGALQRFIEFVARERLGEFRPNQWEVSYLNHIPRGTVWNTPGDWGFFRPLGAVPTVEGLVQGESFGGEWHFVIPEQQGRLHVQWQHGRKFEPQEQEIIVLTCTARGPLELGKADRQAVVQGLDLGHATIVRTFEKLISDEANRYWGLKNASG